MNTLNQFEIYDVSNAQYEDDEQLGTKGKFWYLDGSQSILFKSINSKGYVRVGEDWAEKIACELATLLNLPHAHYELATWHGDRGVISKNFVSNSKGEYLVLGNELLQPFVGVGEKGENLNLQHIDDVYKIMTEIIKNKPLGFHASPHIKTASEFFVGYLMFDVLISNQDRHNENWGCLHTRNNTKHLAPSYDHGAGLARNESDETRLQRLTSNDIGQRLETYTKKAKSQFRDKTTNKKLKLLECFELYADKEPKAKHAWLTRLNDVSDDAILDIIQKIPNSLMSEIAKQFTYQLILTNKQTLCKSM